MGLWSFIIRLFPPKDDATLISELAADVSRYADRYDNAGDSQNAALARDYARRVAAAQSLKAAKSLYREFMAIIAKYQDDLPRDRRYDNDEHTESETDDDWSDDS